MKDIKIFLKKKKKRQYGREHYKNLPEGEKQKHVEYREKYDRMRKSALYNYKNCYFKNNDIKSSFDEEYKNVLKNQF